MVLRKILYLEQKKILLIISCGKKKAIRLHDMKLPASKAYKGPMFQVIDKAKREGRWNSDIFLGIISAKYGFLRDNDEIEYYDMRMTPILSKQHNLNVIKAIKKWQREENFDLIHILMGKNYLGAVAGIERQLSTEIVIQNMGGLGIGQRKLKNLIDKYSKGNSSSALYVNG